MKLKKAAELRQRPPGQSALAHGAEIRQTHQDRLDAFLALTGADRELKASEQREADEHSDELRRLEALAGSVEASPEYRAEHEAYMAEQRRTLGSGFGSIESYREGRPLTRGQTVEGYVRARQLPREDQTELDFGKYLRGMATGNWDDADAERRAMSEGAAGSGGYMVPTLLSAQIVDLVRNRARVLQAGATVVPMESRTLDVPKWTGDPVPGWHTENDTIAVSDATIGKVTLTAQALAVNVQCSWELLEDAPGVEAKLREAFAAAFALRIDQAALYGSGTAPEPRGVKNTTGVTLTPMATNGASPTSWDYVVDAVGRLEDANEEPNGIIYAGRTGRAMAKLKDSTGQPLAVPSYLDGVPRYATGQVPTNLTQGTSTDASDVFVADWRQLLLGVRTELKVAVLDQRYADKGQTGFIGWWRGDIAVARPAAFNVVTGVRP